MPLPIERSSRALGLRIGLRTNADGIARLFDAAFGRPEEDPAQDTKGTVDLAIDVTAALDGGGRWVGDIEEERSAATIVAGVIAGEAAEVAVDPAADEDPFAPAQVGRHDHAPGRSFHRERGALFTAGDDRGSVVCADLAGGQAAAFVTGACRPDIARLVLLESPVWRLATWRGLVALHAASLRIDGVGVVVRGAPGAGKSTLSAAALAAGHGVLADEVTWWDPRPAELSGTNPGMPPTDLPLEPRLRGLGRWIHVEPKLAERFPELVEGALCPAGTPQGKVAIQVRSDRSVTEASPGPVVLLEWTAGARPKRSSWQPLTPEDATRFFDELRIRGEGSQPPTAYQAARDSLVAGGAYVLRSGPPAQAVGALEEIVEDWQRRAQQASKTGAANR